MKSHRTDVLSLVFGLVFLLIAAWWLIGRSVSIGLPMVGWIVAAALISLGAVGLVGALRANRSDNPPD